MKVLCINDTWIPEPGIEEWEQPEIGDIDEVTNEAVLNGRKFYALERFGVRGFLASHFVKLTDETADSLQEKETELVNA